MLNLAAYRYRDVLAARGGPIRRLEISDGVALGRREFVVNAFLRDGLAESLWGGEVFSLANGTGSDASPMVARFKAVSEALERWAHWQAHRAAPADFGFDVDPSTNGMAAYPGLLARQARPAALMEAAERFNLLHWWEGRLAAAESRTPWPGVRAATICSEAPGVTVILFRATAEGFVAYGHGSAPTFLGACRKAAVEMERHATIVARFACAHAGRIDDQLPADAHPIERRSLFFATPAGHECFLERLRSTPSRGPATPRLVYDGAVPGPWSRYADVWRVAYAPPSDRFLGAEENYFLW